MSGCVRVILFVLVGAVVVAMVGASLAASAQRTVQAPADAVNSTAAVTSLATSNATAQFASSGLACVMGLTLFAIVVIAGIAALMALRYWLAKQMRAQPHPVTPVSVPMESLVLPTQAATTTVRQRAVRQSRARTRVSGSWFR